jgi:energy-coupling factor transporter ATP-binding protein EcfA2
VRNIGCIGNDGVEIWLDNIVCLVGKNNVGKSTILRAYELAKGSVSFDASRDRFQHANEDQPSEVILEVHIPDGIGNVDAKWKTAQAGLLIVKSRWQWAAPAYKPVRTTWDPTAGEGGVGAWAEDKKAGGADNVFSSRLPRPLRIGSLEDAAKTEETLLTLSLAPLLESIEKEQRDNSSLLARAIAAVSDHVGGIKDAHTDHFNTIAKRVTSGFQGVFPKLDVSLRIGVGPLVPKMDTLLKSGSGLLIKDGVTETSLPQQGTGARRALFWAMLQVHNELTRSKELRSDHVAKLEKAITDAGKKKVTPELEELIKTSKAQLQAIQEGAPIPKSPDDPALPGYLLLIDEPENALHPLAARAAQRHLYKLAAEADWQVIITTHSPYFINPFEDHTTIVRLDRLADKAGAPVVPKTYVSDSIGFEGDDKRRLQALQQIDPSFAEIFFGSYPVIVEGDTEHAAFISAIVERKHELLDKVTVVRARGKAILAPLIKVLTHFKIDFGVIHDSDPPFRSDGSANGMWTENQKIHANITAARTAGVSVRHRVSIPDFERQFSGEEQSKDKPFAAYQRITADDGLCAEVQQLVSDLVSGEQHHPFDLQDGVDYLDGLRGRVLAWAETNGCAKEIRYAGKPK